MRNNTIAVPCEEYLHRSPPTRTRRIESPLRHSIATFDHIVDSSSTYDHLQRLATTCNKLQRLTTSHFNSQLLKTTQTYVLLHATTCNHLPILTSTYDYPRHETTITIHNDPTTTHIILTTTHNQLQLLATTTTTCNFLRRRTSCFAFLRLTHDYLHRLTTTYFNIPLQPASYYDNLELPTTTYN